MEDRSETAPNSDAEHPVVKFAKKWFPRFMRWSPMVARAVEALRNHTRLSLSTDIGTVVQSIQRLRLIADNSIDTSHDIDMTTLMATCNDIRDLMAGVNGCPRSDMHCTIKLLDKGDSIRDSVFLTIGRSDGWVERWAKEESGAASSYKVADNSAFSALLGFPDRHTAWSGFYHCFAANGLMRHRRYVNERRETFRGIYDATVVLPVLTEPMITHVKPIAFLTFDTRSSRGFPSMPDIYDMHAYDSQDAKAAYVEALHGSLFYHVSSITSCALGMVLPRVIGEAQQS